MTDIAKDHESLDHVYGRIKAVLTQARSRAWQAVNAAMVACYWEVGRIIIEEEQRGKARAEYGKHIIKGVSSRLSSEFGKGFDERNLWFMRSFYSAYPIVNALRPQLSWTHYRLLLRVEKPEARAFYEAEAVKAARDSSLAMFILRAHCGGMDQRPVW